MGRNMREDLKENKSTDRECKYQLYSVWRRDLQMVQSPKQPKSPFDHSFDIFRFLTNEDTGAERNCVYYFRAKH